jgi:hypothetical protein
MAHIFKARKRGVPAWRRRETFSSLGGGALEDVGRGFRSARSAPPRRFQEEHSTTGGTATENMDWTDRTATQETANNPSNTNGDSGRDQNRKGEDRLVPPQNSRIPPNARQTGRAHDRLPHPTHLRPQSTPNQAQNQTNLQALAKNTPEKSLAMRPETRRRRMAHNHPRRPQPIHNRQPDL